MDWNKYKRYSGNWDYTTTTNFWDIVNNASSTNAFNNYPNDNVVADVTDSYKELSSERIEDKGGERKC